MLKIVALGVGLAIMALDPPTPECPHGIARNIPGTDKPFPPIGRMPGHFERLCCEYEVISCFEFRRHFWVWTEDDPASP